MNKFTVTVAKTFILATAIMISAMVIGCKSTTEPASSQAYDSEAAADLTATSLGTESGGAGVSFSDAMGLAQTGSVPTEAVDPKSGIPMSRDSAYDPVTKQHILTITRSGSTGKFSFNAVIIYKYTFKDAAGNSMQYFAKGTTNEVDISVSKQKSKDYGDRLDVDDTANGSWTITNIISGLPILTGSFTRNGTDIFHTVANGDRTFTHTMTINFNADTLVQTTDLGKKYTHLKGPATAHFDGVTAKGYKITRDVVVTFNGDGTATLQVTRTSGDGTIDTFTIDVRIGIFKRWGK